MNKKILIGLLILIATGFYIHGLLGNDVSIVTSVGTVVKTSYSNVELVSNNSAEVYGSEFDDQFYYVIAFNATENPEMYQELCNIICQGQRYQEDGVVFYKEVSQKLVNHYTFHGHSLALKDVSFNGGIKMNEKTGECIICVSSIGLDVIDTLKDIEWGNKTVKIKQIIQ